MKKELQNNKQQKIKIIFYYTIYVIVLFLCFSLIDFLRGGGFDWMDNSLKTLGTLIVLAMCNGLWKIYNKINS